MAFQDAIQDKNQIWALIGHSGTADTAETRRVVVTDAGAVSVDLAGTEPIIVEVGTITAGTVDLLKQGTLTALASGTISAGTLNTLGTVDLLKSGTITRLEGGSVSVISGTISAGSVVVTAGTINTGTVEATVGTVPGIGTVTNLGSITNLGSVTNIGNLPNIPGGSIAVTAGTVEVTNLGTLPNLPGGTINSATITGNIGMSSGTITAGSIIVTAGTVETTSTDLPGGTVDLLSAGTITKLEGGTLNLATVSGNLGTVSMLSAGTVVISGGTVETTGGGGGGTTALQNVAGTTINPATEDTIGQIHEVLARALKNDFTTKGLNVHLVDDSTSAGVVSVGTVTTVTNLTNIGTTNGDTIYLQMLQNYWWTNLGV